MDSGGKPILFIFTQFSGKYGQIWSERLACTIIPFRNLTNSGYATDSWKIVNKLSEENYPGASSTAAKIKRVDLWGKWKFQLK